MLAFVLAPVRAHADRVGRMPEDGVVGFSWVANLDAEQYFGLSIYHVDYHRVGWFIEGKFGRKLSISRSDYYQKLTVSDAENWGHILLQSDKSFDTYDIGLTFGLNDYVAVYGGVGLSDTDGYRRYHDPSGTLGVNGDYWVDDTIDGKDLNAVIGAMVRVSRLVAIQAGYDAAPSGLNVGVGLAFAWP